MLTDVWAYDLVSWHHLYHDSYRFLDKPPKFFVRLSNAWTKRNQRFSSVYRESMKAFEAESGLDFSSLKPAARPRMNGFTLDNRAANLCFATVPERQIMLSGLEYQLLEELCVGGLR